MINVKKERIRYCQDEGRSNRARFPAVGTRFPAGIRRATPTGTNPAASTVDVEPLSKSVADSGVLITYAVTTIFIFIFSCTLSIASQRSATNLALSKSAHADSEEEPASAAVDGNHESYWQSGSTVGDHWLIVDLQKTYAVDRIVMPLVEGMDSLVVELQQDGSWQKVYAGKADNPLIGFEPVNTSQIRISSMGGKQVKIYEVQVFEYDPQPVFVNQSGYSLYKHKRFTAPLAKDAVRFTISKAGQEEVLYESVVENNIGDFTDFQPKDDPGPYEITVHGQNESGTSVPFIIGPNLIEKVSYKPVMDFMIDVRCWFGDARGYTPTDESADCPNLGVAWRDSHQFSFEIPSLLNLYFANPSAFSTQRMPVQGQYLGVREELPEDTPEIIRLIYWAVDIYLRGQVNHTLLKEQLAYFLYAYPWLDDYIPEQVYQEAKDYLFAIWDNEEINRWRWHDIEHTGNLFQTYDFIGTGKGQFPPGHNIIPNLMMYEVAKREGRNDAEHYFQAAYDQTEWLLENLDWNDPRTTKGQRQGEYITITSFVYFLENYPKQAPKGLKEKIEHWADMMIARADNMWDYRRYSDEKWIIPGIAPEATGLLSTTGFNEVGNIAGFPAPALAAASVVSDAAKQERLEQMAMAYVDHVFGRNPSGRHFCFDAITDFEGADLGWYQEYQGGAGILQTARGVLDGSPKETTYPFNPYAGDPGHTEGWVTFNTAWNTGLSYISSSETEIKIYNQDFSNELEKAQQGATIGIELVAPLNLNYDQQENAEAIIYTDNKKIPVKLEEMTKSSRVFRGEYKLTDEIETNERNTTQIKIAYGFGWHEKHKIIVIK